MTHLIYFAVTSVINPNIGSHGIKQKNKQMLCILFIIIIYYYCVRAMEEDFKVTDDRYVYCDECMHEHLDLCREHTLIHILDNPVPANKNCSNRAIDTLPNGWFELKESKIKDAGYGIWTLYDIEKGMKFGPYEGITVVSPSDGRYSWEIKNDGKVSNYIDGHDTSTSNWMRYVNHARYVEEQNLMAYQYRGKIFFRSIVDIKPNTELLVFRGSKFPLPENVYRCENCYLKFCSDTYLEEHVKRCTKIYVAKSTNTTFASNIMSNIVTASSMNQTQNEPVEESKPSTSQVNVVKHDPPISSTSAVLLTSYAQQTMPKPAIDNELLSMPVQQGPTIPTPTPAPTISTVQTLPADAQIIGQHIQQDSNDPTKWQVVQSISAAGVGNPDIPPLARPFVCTWLFCGKRFASSKNLQRHRRTHAHTLRENKNRERH